MLATEPARLNESRSPSPGQIGRYTVEKVIGQGAEGIVSFAINEKGERYAIKTIEMPLATLTTPREKAFLSSLNHENVIRLHETIKEDNKVHLVLEYATKGDLFDYLAAAGGRLTEDEARRIFRQIVKGVEFIHQNSIVHKDIKLENIFIKEDGSVVIGDFGIAIKKGEANTANACGRLFGSLHYVAPEVLLKKQHPLVEKQDLWALGVILFTLCCGYLPFDDDNSDTRIIVRKITNGDFKFPRFPLSNEYKDLVKKLLDVDPPSRSTTKQILLHPWMNK